MKQISKLDKKFITCLNPGLAPLGEVSMEGNERLQGYIMTMREKHKPTDGPGYLHFRVLADYVREAIAAGRASWETLGLTGELDLCSLELECFDQGKKDFGTRIAFDEWIRHALELKIKKLGGVKISQQESAEIFLLFPDEEKAA